MSEVAGRMSIQEGARFLEKPQGGMGVLLGGVPGVKPAKVLILGAGVVGRNAALMASGMGADVTIADISLPTLRHVAEVMPKNVKTLFSSRHNIEAELPDTDLVIGSVLIPGAKAPKLVTRDMLSLDASRHAACRCRHRPGRLLRDLNPDDPFQPHIHHRRHTPLRRGQHPRRGAPHLHPGSDQRHPPLRPPSGRQGVAAGLQG